MMQYLIQMTDDFKDSYAEILNISLESKNISLETQDLVQLLLVRIQELETRINSNRNDE
tara:strand:- start:1101 stop:1277 length:177 start_codon:yes stop_codon:yes gene_type:complete